MNELTHLDLFSGIGGFTLAAEWAGFETIAFSEIRPDQCKLLGRHWPGVRNLGDVRRFNEWEELHGVSLVTGGDPCPKHSRARSNGDSNSPDLAGYFLAVVGRFRPQWVVRENVPSPTVEHFRAGLDALGYGAIIVRTDASPFTGQLRQRDIIIARHQTAWQSVRDCFPFLQDGPGPYTTRLGTREITPALTTHRTRYDSRDCYIYEPAGLRILDAEEREALAGFPSGWTDGFSEACRALMCGNAIVPKVAKSFLGAIAEIESI